MATTRRGFLRNMVGLAGIVSMSRIVSLEVPDEERSLAEKLKDYPAISVSLLDENDKAIRTKVGTYRELFVEKPTVYTAEFEKLPVGVKVKGYRVYHFISEKEIGGEAFTHMFEISHPSDRFTIHLNMRYV